MCSATRALTTGPMHVTNAATSKKPRFAVAVTDKPCGLRPVTRSLPTPRLGRLLAAPGLPRLCRLVEHAPEHALRVLAAPACAAIGRWWGCGQTQRATLAALVSATLLTTPASTAAGFLAGLRLYDVVSSLESIRARTIVVSGEADLLTPPEHSRELVDKIPSAVHLCVRGGGHMLAQQAPHVVAAAIDQAISPHHHPARRPVPPTEVEWWWGRRGGAVDIPGA